MMKKLLYFATAVISLYINAQTQNVDLDQNFGNGGIIVTPYNSEGWDITKVKYFDNKIIFFHTKTQGSNEITTVSRYNMNGAIDTSFGTNGNVEISKTEMVDAWHYEIDNAGNMFIGGQDANNHQNGIIQKYNKNGNIDTSFGTNGNAVIPNADMGNGRFIFSNGKIIFSTQPSGTNGESLYCLNAAGTIDTSFGTNGKVHISDYNSDSFIVSTNDNKILGVKYLDNLNCEVFRLLANGQADPSFIPYAFAIPDEYSFINIKSDELKNIYVCFTINDGMDGTKMLKLKENGTLDTSFGSAGIVEDTNAAYFDIEFVGNKVLFAGAKFNGSSLNPVIKRFNSNGTLDLTFNATGIKEEPSLNLDFFEDIDILPDGNIIGSGETNGQLFLLKYILTGQLSATETALSSVSLFPNPTTDFFEVKLTSNKKVDNVTVFDATGKAVRTVKANTVNVQDLAVGTYVVNIKFENGTTESKKIIKK